MANISLFRLIKSTAFEILGTYECRLALSTLNERKDPCNLPIRAKLAFYLLKVINCFIPLPKLMRKQEQSDIDRTHVYNENLLNLMLNRAYDLPEVLVDTMEPRRINVLVPAFTINTISAGFFGVFNTALFIADQGYKVRLVLFDNFYYIEDEFKKSLKKFPSMEMLFQKLEVEYIGSRKAPLKVSPQDNCVATVWYSAYFAEKINALTNKSPFLYLIQDFEAAFYPFNSSYSVARNSYNFNYNTLCSSESLLDYLKTNQIIPQNNQAISFNNACSYSIYSENEFVKKKSSSKKRFVFYSRPAVNRNMFELAALALINAFKTGIFDGQEWEFYGMGIGNAVVQLNDSTEVKQLPRMSLAEYEEITKTFDLCLTLMASPHPSLIPFDLAASGAIVITNSFETKTKKYFEGISKNIICSAPSLQELTDAIRMGVNRTNDLSTRYKEANIIWPKSWNETWTSEHVDFIHKVFKYE